MGVAYHLTTTGGNSSVATSYLVKNMQLLLIVSIESKYEFQWYRVTTAFLETLQLVIIFQKFPGILRKRLIFADILQTYSEKHKQSVESDFKVLEKSLKTVLDDAHVMVNLYSLPDKPFLYPGKSFAPSEAEKLRKLPLL